jgi:hypothetical protein
MSDRHKWTYRFGHAATFEPLHGTSRPPAILNLSDLGLFVGLAEHYGRDRDILDLIGGWRQVATEVEPMGLPEYVEKAGLPRPIPTRMLDASRATTKDAATTH